MSLLQDGGLKKNLIVIGLLFIVFIVILDHVIVIKLFRKRKTTILKYKDVANANQEDPHLIAFIKAKRIIQPTSKKYNLTHPNKEDPSQYELTKLLKNFFKNRTKGTFIEAGAYDGESLSNTLMLEKKFGWTGLLVEPDPINFKKLSSKNRKAKLINCCISPSAASQVVPFRMSRDGVGSRIATKNKQTTEGKITNVTCFPLYSLMLAMNLTTLDFLSIDLEGIELKVAKTIPWDKVDIKAILVERIWVPEGQDNLRKFFEGENYKLEKTIGDYFFFSKKK